MLKSRQGGPAATAGRGMRSTTSFRRQALLLALLSAPLACAAQYKCVQPDGKTAFQQMPCAEGSSSKKLEMAPAAATGAAPEARKSHWAAIARGAPEVGMSRRELDSAMGQPDKVTQGQRGADSEDELTYHRGDSTHTVTLRNGVVTSVQRRDGAEDTKVAGPRKEAPKRSCMTPAQIRDLEFQASKIENRQNHALRHMIADQKACK